jgi:sugar O-acyltransferase (sialic acid O-acetyltransferase NeuD family)
MKKIICIGATGGCADLLDLIRQINLESNEFKIMGLLDDNFLKLGGEVFDAPILGGTELIRDLLQEHNTVFTTAIGNDSNFTFRGKVIDCFKIPSNKWATLIHPTAVVSSYAQISFGVSIHANVSIGPNVSIGRHSLLLPNIVIGHDTKIFDNVIINAGTTIGGNSVINSSCYLGTGVNLRDHIKIGADTLIGMGSVVVSDCMSNSTYMGNPAKKYEQHN